MSQTTTHQIGAPVHAIPVNPFRIQLKLIKDLIMPHFPAWALNTLILLAVMRTIIILSCISIMVIPSFKGAAARKRHYTLIRRVYPQHSRGSPYLVPNRCFCIAISESISGALYLLAAIASYEFYSGKHFSTGPLSHISTWYGLEILPSYVGIWISAWSLVHACLCDVEGKKNSRLSRFLTPPRYNAFWICGTILFIVVNIYWALRVTLVFSQMESSLDHTFRLLERAVKVWDFSHNISRVSLVQIDAAVKEILRCKDPMELVIKGWSVSWASLLTILTIFYLVTVRLLLRMLRHVLKIRDSEALSPQTQSAIWIELGKETRFLSFLSVAVTLSIVAQFLVAILQWFSATHLEEVDWRIKSALLNHLPGVFLVPAQLIQSWRIFSDTSAADETSFRIIPMDFKNRELPQMTSQLLGWDTTVFWGQEPSMDDANFPGLCELSSKDGRDPHGSDEKLSSAINIEVVQSSVSTEGTL